MTGMPFAVYRIMVREFHKETGVLIIAIFLDVYYYHNCVRREKSVNNFLGNFGSFRN